MDVPEPLLTSYEVADWLKIPHPGVLYLVRTGRLKAIRMTLGKPQRLHFTRADVEAFIETSRV